MLEQYEALVGSMPAIESALASRGQTVSRPNYDGAPEQENKIKSDGESEDEKEGKKNFEATSEEEED